ncbi:MAG TPA: hypothetical protein V6C91_17180 [Coleofasciculaceae cyanobacterium]
MFKRRVLKVELHRLAAGMPFLFKSCTKGNLMPLDRDRKSLAYAVLRQLLPL